MVGYLLKPQGLEVQILEGWVKPDIHPAKNQMFCHTGTLHYCQRRYSHPKEAMQNKIKHICFHIILSRASFILNNLLLNLNWKEKKKELEDKTF